MTKEKKRTPEVLRMGKEDWAVVNREGVFEKRYETRALALSHLERLRLEG